MGSEMCIRDSCVDGVNCLMPEPDRDAVSAALARVLADADLRERLGSEGAQTAKDYTWNRRIDALERFLGHVARPTRVSLDDGPVPEAQGQPAERAAES